MQIRTTAEIVFPCSPSPRTLVLELNNVDQIMNRMHVPTFFFFKQQANIPANASEVFRSSLRELLSHYYPFAGRFRERENGALDVECFDQGVPFLEVWVDISVEAVRPEIDFELLVPKVDPQAAITEIPLLLVQVTHFQCGALCLGLLTHHSLCDGVFAGHLFTAWARIASGKGIGLRPCLDRSLLKARKPPTPSVQHIEYQVAPSVVSTTGNTHGSFQDIAYRTFRVTAATMDVLKARASKQCKIGSSFTRIEALAAHLWRCVTRARGLDAGEEVRLGVAVDGRRKLIPPLPEGYFGNVVFYACAAAKAGELVEKPLPYAAGLVHDAIARVSDDYMRSAVDWIEMPKAITRTFLKPFTGLCLTSWSRMPFRDLDFGWGKPSFDWFHGGPPDGFVNLLPAALDLSHIDAYVALRKDHMASLALSA